MERKYFSVKKEKMEKGNLEIVLSEYRIKGEYYVEVWIYDIEKMEFVRDMRIRGRMENMRKELEKRGEEEIKESIGYGIRKEKVERKKEGGL